MRKTAPKIVHYKVRPPHTAILDSLGPPTRPHHPAISESATDAAANVGVHFEVVGFESPKSGGCHLAIRNYRGLVGHLRTVPNGSERFRGTSERFRTVQRPPLSVHEWFARSSGRVPRVVFGAVVQLGSGPLRPRTASHGLMQSGHNFQLSYFWLTWLKSCLNVHKGVTHLLFTWTFNVWPSICCITVFPVFLTKA